MKIALDVMGGDHAPISNIKGAFSYLYNENDPSIKIILVGDGKKIEKILSSKDKYKELIDKGSIEIIHTTQIVEMDEKPSRIFKTKPDSSLVKCINLIKPFVVRLSQLKFIIIVL